MWRAGDVEWIINAIRGETTVREARWILLLAAAILVLPRLGSAAVPEYHRVEGWPAAGAPEYGTIAVSAVTVDAAGQTYVFQRAPHPVLVFDRDGKYLQSWGAGLFTHPHGCRVDPDGNLWVTDDSDHRVMKFTTEGKLLATFGVRNQRGVDSTHFNRPTDVAFAPSGDVYISDGYGNSRGVRLSHDGKFLGSWGRRGAGEGEFDLPHSVAVDAAGKVYVADRENARIQIFTPDGKFLAQWEDVGHPYGLALARDQQLFVTDGIANTVSLWSHDHRLRARWGGPGQMAMPHLLCVDDRGAVYVAEVNGKRVAKYVR